MRPERGVGTPPIQVALLLATVTLGGCAGAAVATYGTKESVSADFVLAAERNRFAFSLEPVTYTAAEVIAHWGEPDAVERLAACEVLVYEGGVAWSGAGAFVGVVPVPLAVPTGRYKSRFYARDGAVVGLVREYGEIDRMAGYTCGSNECGATAGEKVNEPTIDPERARAEWCGPGSAIIEEPSPNS